MTDPEAEAWAFYREAANLGAVWTLRDDEGFPVSRTPSGQKTQAFWSSRKRVEQVIRAVPALRHLSPYEISWQDFAESWAPGMAADHMLAAINWDGVANVYHMPPDQLVGAVNAMAGRT